MATRQGVQAGRAYVLIEAIDKTGKVLSGVNKRFANLSRQFTALGRQLAFLGGTLSIPFISAIDSAKNFSDEMLALKSVLEITDDAATSLEKRIRDLGKSTSFTAGQVAAAATSLARGGFSSREIEDSLKGVLDFARAGRTELATAATVMVRAIRSFNMSADQGSEVADKFFTAAKNGTTTVEELAQALSFSGGTADTLGFSLGTTLAILSKMSNRMLFGTKAGTSLNQMFLRLATEADKVRDVLGVDVEGALGKDGQDTLNLIVRIGAALRGLGDVEKVKTVADIFNVRGARAALVTEQIEGILDVADQMDESAGAAAKASARMDSGIGGSIRRIMSAFDELKISVGLAFEDIFKTLEKTIIPVINRLSAWAKANKEVFIQIAKGIIIITGLGAALIALGATFGVGSFIIGGLTTLLSLISSFGPIVAKAMLIGGAAVALFAATWSKIKTNVLSFIQAVKIQWGKFSEFFMKEWGDTIKAFQDAWKESKPLVIGFLKGMLGLLQALLPVLVEVGKALTNAILTPLKLIANFFETISIVFKGLVDYIKEVVEDPGSIFRSFEADKPRKKQHKLTKEQADADKRMGISLFKRHRQQQAHAKVARGEGGPLTGGRISRPGDRNIPTPKRGPTQEQIDRRKELVKEIVERKRALAVQDQERELERKRAELARKHEVEDIKREQMEIAKLQIKLRNEADKEKQRSLKEEITNRRRELQREHQEQLLQQQEIALRERERLHERNKEQTQIAALEKELGQRVKITALRRTSPRDTATAAAGGVDPNVRRRLSMIEQMRQRLQTARERTLQGPATTSIPEALQKGSVEAAQMVARNKSTQRQISLLASIDRRLDHLNRTESTLLNKTAEGGAVAVGG